MTTERIANYGTFEDKKEALMKDIKAVVGDADALLKTIAHSTAEEFAAAQTLVDGKLDDAKSRLDDARTAIAKKAKCAAEATQAYAEDNPWKLFGLAAAIGVIVGIAVSRR
ncbi:MAG: DUF883 family protein [Rhodocyclaceae bacterium]|nr:DUF883 family protein [Rhodocyclaceae bacterium]